MQVNHSRFIDMSRITVSRFVEKLYRLGKKTNKAGSRSEIEKGIVGQGK